MSFQLVSSQKINSVSAGVSLTGPSDRILPNVSNPPDGYRKIDPQGSMCFNILDQQMYYSTGVIWQQFSAGGDTVESVIGTANQVIVNNTVGVPQTNIITLTLPQSISTASTLRFAKLGLGVAASNNLLSVLGGASIGYADTAAPANGLIVQGSTSIGATTAPSLFNVGTSNQFQISTLGVVTSGTWQGSAIGAQYGGTGQTSYTIGDLLYASSPVALSKLPAGTLNYVLTSNGPTSPPSWQPPPAASVSGTVNQINVSSIGNVSTLSLSNTLLIPGTISVNAGIFSAGAGNQFQINTSGVVTTGTWQGGAITAQYGGTGQTSYTIGDLIYASGATTLSKLNAGTANFVLTSGGPGVAPSWQANVSISGTSNQINVSTVGNVSTVSLSNTIVAPGSLAVTGTFSVGSGQFSVNASGVVTAGTWNGTAIETLYGGTGLTTYTTGDILYAVNSTTLGKLGIGTAGYVLTSGGAGGAPYWNAPITTSGTLNQIVATPSGNNVTLSLSPTLVAPGSLTVSSSFQSGAGGFVVGATGIVTTGTWQGSPIGLAYGGTGTNLTAVQGGIVYSTASALAITAAGTSGQVLVSQGTAAPQWQTASGVFVTSLSGITNRITVNGIAGPVTGAVTISTPQDLGTTSIVRFQRMGINVAASSNNLSVAGSASIGYGDTAAPTNGLIVSGKVSIGNPTSTVSALNVGSSGQFQINSTGAIISGTWNGGTVTVPYGGTGITSGTQYGILYFDTTTTLSTIAPSVSTNYVLHGNNAGAPTWSLVNLASDVTGVIPLANGGTNANLTAVQGGVLYSGASALAISAAGTSGQLLHSGGTGAPTWSLVSLTADVTGVLPLANGGTNASLVASQGSIVYSTTTGMAMSAAGTSGQILHSAGTGAPTWAAVNLASEVTGLLPLANGGTNVNLTPVQGGVVYSTAGALAVSAAGTSGQYLQSNGTAAPSWSNPLVPSIETVSSAGALLASGTSVVNGSNASFTVTLGTSSSGVIKTVQLLSMATQPITVDCSNGNSGAFILDINNTIKTLLYYNNAWTIESSPDNITSFFPLIQQGAKLVGTTSVGTTYQGYAVALSADGNTLAVGGPQDASGTGAVWIFVRTNGNTWTQQARLVSTDWIGVPQQGSSVALSSDGNTLAFGGPQNNPTGGAWIFTRSGSTWSQQQNVLIGTGATGTSNQGASVALSSDGNTVAIGGPNDNTNVGATWVFTRTGGVWTQQGAKIVGASGVGTSGQGSSVTLSSDGNTLGIGGPNDNNGAGATWVFTRTSGSWSQQARLIGTGATGSPAARQGISLSMAANGNTLAVGGWQDNSGAGATWVFTRSSGSWTQQGAKIIGTGATGTASAQGSGVALSSDGNTLVVGALNDNSNIGANWVFTRYNNVWTQRGTKLVGTGGTSATLFQGRSVAISSNGATFVSGGYADNGGVGASWVFI